MSSVSPLNNYNFSTTATLLDTPLRPSAKRSMQIWERFLHENSPGYRAKRSENSEYVIQEIATPWLDFYIQHQIEQPQGQIRPLVTISEMDSNDPPLFIPGSPLHIRETTIDALLRFKVNSRDSLLMLTPFERIAVANQILRQQGENAKNLLFYESFYSAVDSDLRGFSQPQNQFHRTMTYLDRIKTAFSPEMSNSTDLWIQARTDAILSNAKIDYFDACAPCQKIFKIKSITGVFRDYDLRSQESPLPYLKAHLKFHRWPRICQMHSGVIRR